MHAIQQEQKNLKEENDVKKSRFSTEKRRQKCGAHESLHIEKQNTWKEENMQETRRSLMWK